MAQTPATNKQIPDNSILDHFNKQSYLGNRYSFILALTASGTTEVAQLLLSNPAVSSLAFPNQVALFVDLRRMAGMTASANNIMRVYLNPTASDVGAAQVEQNLRPASPNTATGVITSGPTVSANGVLIEALSTLNVSTVQSDNLVILDPGQSMLITIQTASSAVVNAQISWYEL